MPYLENLNESQREAVLKTGTHLLVQAGAGSGKTRVIISRVLHHILGQNIAPWRILAVTFTNRAAREMRERLEAELEPEISSQVLIRTFHSFGVWVLRRYARHCGLASSFSIYDNEDSIALLKQTVPSLGRFTGSMYYWIARAKESGLEPDSPALEQITTEPDFPDLFFQYERALRQSGNVDFADLIGLPLYLLKSDRKIRETLRERFSRVLVDEYQDSNKLQNELLRFLVASGTPEDRPLPEGRGLAQELCVVGDEDQSIYGFRGADVRSILDFQQNFPPAEIVKLERNYRSTKPILDLANDIIRHNRERLGKTLVSVQETGAPPELHYFEEALEEAVFCAQKIRENPDLCSGILYRTNAQSRIFEQVFREWEIPYRLVGNTSFYAREEVKDVIAYLKALLNEFDLVAFERILNKPKRNLGNKARQVLRECCTVQRIGYLKAAETVLEKEALGRPSLKKLKEFVSLYRSLRELLDQDGEGLPLREIVERTIENTGLRALYEDRDAVEGTERAVNFSLLLEEAGLFGRGTQALVAFLERVDLESQEFDESDSEEYRRLAERQLLITMHNTKGLEFDRVFITGLELGLFPKIDNLSDPAAMEEERRLFYVAVTRAKKELYLSAARSRSLYGNYLRSLSPFVEELSPELIRDLSGILTGKREKSDLGGLSFGSVPKGYLRQRASSAGSFPVGTRVDHLDYGLGYVVKRKCSGEVTTLMIRLDDGRLIRLQLEFQGNKLSDLGTGGDG